VGVWDLQREWGSRWCVVLVLVIETFGLWQQLLHGTPIRAVSVQQLLAAMCSVLQADTRWLILIEPDPNRVCAHA
jgi:hypothetical protein